MNGRRRQRTVLEGRSAVAAVRSGHRRDRHRSTAGDVRPQAALEAVQEQAPEALLYGLMQLYEKIQGEEFADYR